MQVPLYLLKPNLHIATCNLRAQEEMFGPAALCAEWYMERCVISELFIAHIGHHGDDRLQIMETTGCNRNPPV